MLNRKFNLNDKCEIIAQSCSQLSPYKTALVWRLIGFDDLNDLKFYFQVQLEVTEGSTKIHDATFNLCDPKPKPEMLKFSLAGWAIPNRCPNDESIKYCSNATNALQLSAGTQKMLSLFALRSIVKLRIIITHDTGTSCFESMDSIVKQSNKTIWARIPYLQFLISKPFRSF